MPEQAAPEERIALALERKACAKQKVYRTTLQVFEELKRQLQEQESTLADKFKKIDPDVAIDFRAIGKHEAEMKYAGDTLLFLMHTNVFTFQDDHGIFKTKYVQDDDLRAYCGMISIYNFVSDSLKYTRLQDSGVLLARIFVNKERHFFVEGQRQLGFLYNDFENAVMDDTYLKAIIEAASLYAIDLDLKVQPYTEVQEMSVLEKLQQSNHSRLRTGKRLGFQLIGQQEEPGDDNTNGERL